MKKLVFYVCLLLSSAKIFADNQKIAIKVQINSIGQLSSMEVAVNNFSCKGKNNGYSYSGFQGTGTGLDVYVTGPFSGDKRNDCGEIGGSNHNPYFVINDMTINFSASPNGVHTNYTCLIKTKFGTTYENNGSFYDRLLGDAQDWTSCGDNTGLRYKVDNGTNGGAGGYDPGKIEIEPLPTDYAKVNFTVNNITPSKENAVKVSNYGDMTCGGMANAYKIEGFVGSDGESSILTISGPFSGDRRETCTIDGISTYFAVSGFTVEFEDDGSPHTCKITEWGTTYNKGLMGDPYSKVIIDNYGDYGEISNSQNCHDAYGGTYKYFINRLLGGISQYDTVNIVNEAS